MSDHIRNTGPMLASPRCGAKTRSAGAPRSNQNASKHGLFTKEVIAERRQIQALLGDAWKLLQGMK